ncbi:BspA family leucine-rich repeat surface protein [uncultured Limosilactobacillus sp.]|uniref:BspA family leucine-rich repeat surface protein n=1 Tax=uncultured Limosilactobacillus sp. TaxID=2837629 RepID=UPI0025D2A116|nr:BspA family leucine-rich repeat surface protein [uncultured Limosilactobacillus sp.]
MLSKKNLSEQERQLTSNPNRFTLRKLSVGVCSVIAGLSFMGLNAHADQVAANKQSSQPTDGEQATSSATSQLQSAKQVALSSAGNSTATTPVNARDHAEPSPISEVKQQQPAARMTELAANAHVTDQDQVNVSAWKYTQQSDGILLNGYNGTAQNGQYIVPNSYDFTKAGVIQAGQKVYLEKTLPQQLHGTQFIISHNGNGKVIAKGTDWSGAFTGTPYQLIDVGNLDVSHVTNMSQLFAIVWNLKEVKGLANWDTHSLTNMSGMFTMDQALTSVDSMANWDVSHVTNMSRVFAGCEQLKIHLDFSHWNTSSVTNTEAMFCNNQLAGINISGWDLSHDTNVNQMFGFGDTLGIGYIWAPAFVNMMGVKMPTQAHFDMNSFGPNRDGSVPQSHQLIVYSDDPTILALNGHNHPLNQITIKTSDGKLNKTIKLDNFVFNGKDALIAALQAMTTKAKINAMVTAVEGDSGKTVAESNFDSTGSLKHDYQSAANDPVALVTGPGNIYTVALQGPEYTQQIIYVDGNQQVGETRITGHLDGNDNQATISAAKLNDQIAQKMPTGYYMTSALLTTDVNINSTNPTAIKVQVANQAQLTITYQTADGHQVGQPVVKDGKVGDTLDITAPDNYALVHNDQSHYTLLPQAQQKITVLVQHLSGTITVEYVDTDKDNELVKDQHFTGDVGEPAHLKYQVPDGYDLVGQLPSTDYSYTQDGQTIIIKLQHKAASVEVQYVDTDNDNQVVQQKTFDGRVGVATTLNFNVPADYDLVSQLPATNYVFANAGANNPIVVKLQHKAASVEVRYVDTDNDNHVVKQQTFNGRVGVPTTLTFDSPANYDLVSTLPSTNYTFTKAGANDSIVIKMKHKAASVDVQYVDGTNVISHQVVNGRVGVSTELSFTLPTGYVAAGQMPAATYTFTDQVGQKLIVPVKRAQENVNVIYQDEDGNVVTTKTVSGNYGQAVQLPAAPAGYELADGQSATYTLTDQPNQQVTVKVNHAQETATVIFQDENGNQVGQPQTISGKYGQIVDLPAAPAGYELAANQPTTYTLTADGNQQVILHVNRAQETVEIVYYADGKQVGQAEPISCHYGDVLRLTFQEANENSVAALTTFAAQRTIPVTLTLPVGYELADSNQTPMDYHVVNTAEKTVAIEVKKIAADVQVIYQTADGRQVKTETVNGHVGDLVTLNFTAPNGYQLTEGQPTSQSLALSRTNAPVIVNVTAIPVSASVDIKYETADGTVLKSETVDGYVGDSTTLHFTAPDGYQLAEGQAASQDLTFNQTNEPLVVKVQATATTPDHGEHGQPTTPTTDKEQQGQKPSTSVPEGQDNGDRSTTSQQTSGHVTAVAKDANNGQNEKLPQTGDHRGGSLAALGSVTLMLALGLAGKVRRHE